MKSAYEVALQRLEKEGIEPPRDDALTQQARERMAESRNRAEARLAELEILHRDRLAAEQDPLERKKLEDGYQAERGRIESKREREIERLRNDDRATPS